MDYETTQEQGCEDCLCLNQDGYDAFSEAVGKYFKGETHYELDKTEGIFYFLRILPDVRPNRIKLGYTTNLMLRIAKHRKTCPSLEILGHWKYLKGSEQFIINVISNSPDIVHVGHGVFDIPDVDAALKRASTFFDMLPA